MYDFCCSFYFLKSLKAAGFCVQRGSRSLCRTFYPDAVLGKWEAKLDVLIRTQPFKKLRHHIHFWQQTERMPSLMLDLLFFSKLERFQWDVLLPRIFLLILIM